jgi:hypothetical protein
MHKNATKCNKTQSKWCINKHGASKIIDTFETYQSAQKYVHLDEGLVTGILVCLVVCKVWLYMTTCPSFLAAHARLRLLEVLLYSRTMVV